MQSEKKTNKQQIQKILVKSVIDEEQLVAWTHSNYFKGLKKSSARANAKLVTWYGSKASFIKKGEKMELLALEGS